VKTFVTGLLQRIRSPHTWLAAALIVVGAVEARAQGAYGTIKGRLVWGGNEVPPAKNLVEVGAAPKDPSVCAKNEAIPDHSLVVDPKTKGVRYAFAYLNKPLGANPEAVKELVARAPQVVIDQKNCEFIPYVTAMYQDQPLVLKSSDPVNHNVRFSAFLNAPFNQILPPNGQVELKLVGERRPIPLNCDIHPWMKGFIMVFDHPFFDVTEEDGSFEIQGVPAGAQSLVLWQETKGYVTTGAARGQAVQVQAGKTTDVGEIQLVK
jgi:hypothetical protein